MPCGGIIEHMGMPAAIEEKFYEALSFLKDHKFLKTSSGQNPNSDWNRLTEEGEKVKINEDNTILIKRFSEELVEMFEQSVFLMAGKNENGDFDNGTCFLFDKNDDSLILLTAKHVVEGITSEQKIYLSKDKSISVNLDNVKIRKSPDSDVAVLLLSKSHAVDTIKCHRTFKNVSNTYKQGEDVVSLGYPHLARLKEISLNSSKNNISLPHAEEFYGERSILLDRFLSPGYSGGPLINMKGELLGIISKNLINTKDSSKTDGDKFASIVPFVEVENILKN
jgi:S1-C subfamily serine protease